MKTSSAIQLNIVCRIDADGRNSLTNPSVQPPGGV